ncbi:hypothetical protein [Streptomyces enissocaesilis]|uniref:hypothetical protein n=1 Tax=Streptomyces enissocaesilis TaxID=332589 RepID=UPI0031D6F7B0
MNVHEAAVLNALPPGAPAPNLLGIHRPADWTAVVIAHLDGSHPNLCPASGDAEQTWALLDTLTSSPAQPRPDAVRRSGEHGALHGRRSARLGRTGRPTSRPPLELSCRSSPNGKRLGPPSPAETASSTAAWADSMVRDHDRDVTFVDWAYVTTGPAFIDAASLAPQLILAGHAPAGIARLLRDYPATAISPDTTTAFLAVLTGHWHRNTRKPAPPAPLDCAPTSTGPPRPDSPSSATS